MADRFPLYLPPDARRLFQTESLLRRFAQMAQWDRDARLLELYASLGGLALVRALGGTLEIIDPDAHAIDLVRERARIAGVADQVSLINDEATKLNFAPESFHGIFSFGHVLGTPGELAKRFRPLLAPKGRVGFSCIVKVGRKPSQAAIDYWENRLGTQLGLPREALLAVEAAGYEPELIESAGEQELDEYYKDLEALLSRPGAPEGEGPTALKEEIAVYRAQKGHVGVTHAFLVARRKEQGEKPPLSRDSG